MNAPELRQLRYLVTLASELHFGRAARRIGIAQPALSQQIRALEHRLGFEVFERTSRRVVLSAAGSVLLAKLQHSLAELDRAIDEGRDVAAGRAGSLTVGFSANSMMTVLPQMIRRFRARHPRVRVVLRERASSLQLEMLLAGEIDIAFVSEVGDDQAVERVEVWREPFVAVTQSGFGSTGRRLTLSDLAGQPFIWFPRAQIPGLFDRLVGLCRTAGFEPTVSQTAESWHMIAHLVSTGLGVSVAPASIKRYRVSRLQYFSLPRTAGNVGIYMCRAAANTSPAALAFFAQGPAV